MTDALADEFWTAHRCCSCAADGYACCASGLCPKVVPNGLRPPEPVPERTGRRRYRRPKPRTTAHPRRRAMPQSARIV